MSKRTEIKAGLVVIVGGIVVLAAIAMVFIALTQFAQPIQSGTYTGETIDYSHQRGIVFQTNDLTTKTNDRSSKTEDWCVPDNEPQLVEQVRGIEDGTQVRITYHRPLWIWPDTCDGGLKVIDSITVVNETSSND